MLEQTASATTLDELRTFVHTTLCDKENLLADQFLLRELPLVTRGKPSGIQFTVKGPRSIRLGAIWASDQNMINFYDTQGERYLKVKLTVSPAIAEAA
jgi:hypothetical protein